MPLAESASHITVVAQNTAAALRKCASGHGQTSSSTALGAYLLAAAALRPVERMRIRARPDVLIDGPGRVSAGRRGSSTRGTHAHPAEFDDPGSPQFRVPHPQLPMPAVASLCSARRIRRSGLAPIPCAAPATANAGRRLVVLCTPNSTPAGERNRPRSPAGSATGGRIVRSGHSGHAPAGERNRPRSPAGSATGGRIVRSGHSGHAPAGALR